MMRVISISVISFFLVVSTSFAGWQSDISDNQFKAIEYIGGCMTGTCPKWPKLKQSTGWKSVRAYNEVVTYMNVATNLAKAGKYNAIQLPDFKYGPGQSGWSSQKK